jgi:hypothetical protein
MSHRFLVCARIVRGLSASHAFIALLRCIESMSRLTGQPFRHICNRLKIRRDPAHWPTLPEMWAVLDQLEAERDAFLSEYHRLVTERRQQKKAWRAGGKPPQPGRLEEMIAQRNSHKTPRVGCWGWRRLRER